MGRKRGNKASCWQVGKMDVILEQRTQTHFNHRVVVNNTLKK